MRIVSLVPAATEMVVALGAEDSLVGISHQCDWPLSVRRLPKVTTTPIDSARSSGAIDADVRRLGGAGAPVIGVDAGVLRSLAPDLILAQDLCEVCAVTDAGVMALAQALTPPPRVVSLTARTLPGVFGDIVGVAAAIDLADEGEELVAGLRYRLDRLAAHPPATPVRVICIEWLDPIYLAGHWVPDLIAAAGGIDVGARPGTHSRVVTLQEIRALAPELVIVALCGFGLERAALEYREFEPAASPGFGGAVWLLDGNAYTSRPGPRLVDAAVRISAAIRRTEMDGLRRWG